MSESLNTIVKKCVKALVTNSLNTNASSIAIRFHKRDLRLHVIDNGKGLSADDLEQLGVDGHGAGEVISSKCLRSFEKNVVQLQSVTTSVLVMSRHKDNDTFGKMLTKNCVYESRQMPKRPAQGTTVILKIRRQKIDDTSAFIPELQSIVGSFALNNPQVSFSFRDDETMKTIFGIRKQNPPMDTLEIICHQILDSEKIQYLQNETIKDGVMTGYFGYDCSREIIQKVFLNNEEINCPEIEAIVITNYLKTVNAQGKGNDLNFGLKKEKIFFLLYIKSPDDSLHNLIEDEGLLDTVELRIVRAVFLQLQTISLNMLKHIFPLKIEEPVRKKPMISKKRKSNEVKIAFQKKKLLPDLTQISLPLLNFSCRDFRVSTTRYQRLNDKRSNQDSKQFIVSESKTVSDIEDFSLIENSEDIGDFNSNLKAELDEDREAREMEEKKANSWEQMSFDLEDVGEWSDWIYEDSHSHDFNQQTYYNFLPQKLRPLQVKRQQQLTRREFFNRPREMGIFKWNRTEHKIEQTNLPRRQDSHVRPCKNSQKKMEVTLDKEILKNIKVLNQVNKEFIAGVAQYENKKYLILIDQHAMDERIRYESLLREYRCNQNALLLSYLYRPLEIPDLPEQIMTLIFKNSQVLKRFGVTFKEKNKTSIVVSTVPNCFLSKRRNNPVIMINSVKELIMEIGGKLISKSGTKSLPISIHNSIASEACHGAIRFGDVLNVNQCDTLVSHWIETDLPNRCAHGRPAVVPLLEINAFSRRYQQVFKEKLNFGSLKKQLK